jgi:hypothetical protein
VVAGDVARRRQGTAVLCRAGAAVLGCAVASAAVAGSAVAGAAVSGG